MLKLGHLGTLMNLIALEMSDGKKVDQLCHCASNQSLYQGLCFCRIYGKGVWSSLPVTIMKSKVVAKNSKVLYFIYFVNDCGKVCLW